MYIFRPGIEHDKITMLSSKQSDPNRNNSLVRNQSCKGRTEPLTCRLSPSLTAPHPPRHTRPPPFSLASPFRPPLSAQQPAGGRPPPFSSPPLTAGPPPRG